MPPYVLCIRCQNIPVAVFGDVCEECARIQREQDAKAKATLDRLERKPRNPKRWLREVAK